MSSTPSDAATVSRYGAAIYVFYVFSCCCICVSAYYDICVLFSCCGDEERSIRRRDSIGAFSSPAAVMRSAASDAATAKVLSCLFSCCGD